MTVWLTKSSFSGTCATIFRAVMNQLSNRHVRRELVLFLNNDVIFPDAADALEMMIAEMRAKPELGGLGTVLHYPDRTANMLVSICWMKALARLCHHPGHGAAPPRRAHGESWPTMAVTGACLLTRSALFADVGGFDEAYRTECQDIALCLAMRRRGFEMAVINAGRIIHLENATRLAGRGLAGPPAVRAQMGESWKWSDDQNPC